jgi:hypothetical protein
VPAMDDIDREILRHGADRLDAQKYDGVLFQKGRKIPLRKHWMTERMTGAQIDFWLRRYAFNVGILMGNLRRLPVSIMAVDYESVEARVRFRAEFGLPESPMVAKTARGFHEYFRTTLINQKTVIGFRDEVDLKFTGAVLAPPSWRDDVGLRYEWQSGVVAPGDLPTFPSEILAEPTAETKPSPIALPPTGLSEEKQVSYVGKIDKSEQGRSGASSCIKAALKILTLTKGEVGEAWRLMLLYNRTRCEPPWDESDDAKPQDSLRRKFETALGWWRPRR